MRVPDNQNLTNKTFDLGHVCMPLVRLLLTSDLSWANREEIAFAIQNNIRIYKEHEKEAAHLSGNEWATALRGDKQS